MKSTLVVFCALLCAASGEAKKNKDRGGADVYIQFGPADRTVIHEYYRAQPSGLPPGLAKRNGSLPPGLEKQLRRNGRLPPGLEKKLMPFPVEVERRLPPLPIGMQRGYIDDRAIIYNPRSRAIVDVMIFGR